MTTFSVNPNRFNPYPNFKFAVVKDNKRVAVVSKISPLKRVTEVIEHRSGGDNSLIRKSPGRHKYEPITLERGLTHDLEFYNWAAKVWDVVGGAGSESSLKDFRRDITIELYNEAGQKVMAYNIFKCWVSEFQALPELDANANAIAIES